MRRKVCLSTIALIMLMVLLSLTGLFVRNICCRLIDPEVHVIPSEVNIGQQVVVEAEINVVSG